MVVCQHRAEGDERNCWWRKTSFYAALHRPRHKEPLKLHQRSVGIQVAALAVSESQPASEPVPELESRQARARDDMQLSLSYEVGVRSMYHMSL